MSQLEEEKLFFYEPMFLQNSALNKETALDYFALSPFYEKSCLNEILKMQSHNTKININEHLSRMEGVYYELDDNELTNLFIIYKKEILEAESTILKAYYIMYGYIYCCPGLNHLSDNKICEILWRMNNSLDFYEENKKFDFIRGIEFSDRNISTGNVSEIETAFFIDSLKEFVYNLNKNK